MKFLRLTHRQSGKDIFLNSERIDAIDPDTDGCFIRHGTIVVQVKESHRYVLDLVEESKHKQQREKREYE